MLESPQNLSLQSSAATGYRFVRRVAEGGIGIIDEVFDPELERSLALKSIRPDRLSEPAVIHRFLREARITAKLQHPGIVPVYQVRRDLDQSPAYAMRLIEGESLAGAVCKVRKDRKSFDAEQRGLRRLLQVFVSACNTIAYAHSAGVIHRDIKPANILLGKFGEVFVVDWGLACEYRSGPGGETSETKSEMAVTIPEIAAVPPWQTASGTIFGTPAWMSPEQANGSPITPASDIFSLGATLFTILTGEPPLPGNDSLLMVAQLQLGSLRAPREVDASIPFALNAICCKAMAVEPSARYASASELAGDVENWLAGEPILAARESFSERFRRWQHRHRVKLSVGFALLLASTIALGISTALIDRERAAADDQRLSAEANARMVAIQAEQVRRAAVLIEDQENLARRTIREFTRLGRRPEMLAHPIRSEFLRVAADYYRAAASRTPQQGCHAREYALALVEAGLVENALGHRADAEAHLRTARTIFADLISVEPTNPEIIYRAAQAAAVEADIAYQAGDTDRCGTLHQEALNLLADWSARFPNHTDGLLQVGISTLALGKIAASRSAWHESLPLLEEAVRLFRSFPMSNSPSDPLPSHLAGALHSLGEVADDLREPRRAEELFRQALAVLFEGNLPPADVGRRSQTAEIYRSLAETLGNQGRQAEAIRTSAEGLAIQRALAEAYPGQHYFGIKLLKALNTHAMFILPHRQLPELHSLLGEADTLSSELHRHLPFTPQLIAAHSRTLRLTGKVFSFEKQSKQARTLWQRAEAHLRDLIRHNPRDQAYRAELGATLADLATLALDENDLTEAHRLFDAAIAELHSVLQVGDKGSARLYLRNSYWGRAELHRLEGEWLKSEADYRLAVEQGEFPNDLVLRCRRCPVLAVIGHFLELHRELVLLSPLSKDPGLRSQLILAVRYDNLRNWFSSILSPHHTLGFGLRFGVSEWFARSLGRDR